MNDDRLAAALRGFYHQSDTAPTDAERSVRAAVSRVATTRQRSRWWPLPALTAKPSTTPDTDATPVTGGTRSMFSTSKLMAVVATLAVAGGLYTAGMITTQPEPAVAPAAEAPSWATPVTGTRVSVDDVNTDAMEWIEGEGWNEIRNYKLAETYEWSDPRLPASVATVINLAESADDSWRGQVMHAALLLEDIDGHWTGMETSFANEDELGYAIGELTGHGAYEGLSAVLRWTTDDPDCITCLVAEGYIYERELPPMPAPLAPAAE